MPTASTAAPHTAVAVFLIIASSFSQSLPGAFPAGGHVVVVAGVAVHIRLSLIHIFVLLVPPVREAFGGAAMDAWQWATVLGLAFLSLVQTEAAKAIGRWRARRGQATAGLRG